MSAGQGFLAAASVMALFAGAASAAGLPTAPFSGNAAPFQIPKGAKILYNQNSNAGVAIVCMNFTSGTYSDYDEQCADDFIVPKGKAWTITEVDVTGVFFDGSGPANSENVVFYQNKRGMPGAAVRNGTFNKLQGSGSTGDFAIMLPKDGLTLKAGHYWVSVGANMDFSSDGEWGWESDGVQNFDQAMCRNSGGSWSACALGFLFDLKGTSRNK